MPNKRKLIVAGVIVVLAIIYVLVNPRIIEVFMASYQDDTELVEDTDVNDEVSLKTNEGSQELLDLAVTKNVYESETEYILEVVLADSLEFVPHEDAGNVDIDDQVYATLYVNGERLPSIIADRWFYYSTEEKEDIRFRIELRESNGEVYLKDNLPVTKTIFIPWED